MARVTRTTYTRGKKYARSKKKTSSYGRRRGYIKKVGVPRPTVAFPRTRLVRHVYYDNVTIPAPQAAGSPSTYGFRANSMYDPNYSGGGHQPMYYDQMSAIYTKYQVIASFIEVTLDQTDSTQNNYKIVVTSDNALQNDVAAVLEEYGASRPLINSSRSSPKVLKASWNAKKWYKTTLSGLMADNSKNTATGSNPTESIYYHIWSAPCVPSTIMDSQAIQVKLILICMWRDPQDAPTS